MRRLPATCSPNKPNYYLANLGPLWHSLRPRRLAKTLENRPQQRAQGSQNNRTLTQCNSATIGHKSIGGYMHWANCSYCCRYNQWITPHRLTTIYGDFEHENPHGVQKGQLRWQSRNATAAAYKLGEGGLFPQSAFMLQPQHATPPLFLSLTTPNVGVSGGYVWQNCNSRCCGQTAAQVQLTWRCSMWANIGNDTFSAESKSCLDPKFRRTAAWDWGSPM